MTDDLATLNLQKINNLMATVGAEGFDQSIAEQVDRARAAQASGDTREAIAISTKVLQRLGNMEKGGV
ncbi:hypothetical protein AR457_37410 [Streptomyces agglomeratus]|uniref:Uncharacterized protein n=1 Tax=Streptomyces agglomeratus TaxID=285458 RepID=A0A1E5NYT0_9ACTN|nr:hypothetical protein [Streptomyces agglomeratus]OEJ21473.1 hypothetical protein AS594_38640 [Streptomyces agglomeratus]OEJ22907.1 hypothetical protein AR457_37410 [Streptomyces agglomeratus]OEJ36485.1 hypothetical protein BGK72_37910 [Streptomyces agglomeratus]OEJ56500.1 hypothetical protein BGM19_38195 [Streptomyces agglomeratus]